MLTFRDTLRRFVPPWLVDRVRQGFTNAYKLLYAFALIIDAGMQFVIEGVRAKLPTIGTLTALPMIGRDRGIPRGFDESDTAYAGRLVNWIPDHKTKGNAYTLMRQIRGYLSPFLPLMRVRNVSGAWYTLNPDGSVERAVGLNWNWDNDFVHWDRFWLIIYPDPALWQRDGTWGDGSVWGDGGTWGSTATIDQIASIRSLLSTWKPGDAVCNNVIISFDSAAFDPTGTAPPLPDGTWGTDGKNVGGVEVASRDSRAIYWDGVA